jgi:hypothetical protein
MYLRSLGIHCLGTVPSCKLSSDSVENEKKKWCAVIPKIILTMYLALMYPLFCGTILKRYNTCQPMLARINLHPKIIANSRRKQLGGIKTQKHYEIECPHIIREYHRHMGSVDLMDGL